MTSGPQLRVLPSPATEQPRHQTPRLKLKPKTSATGYVDGAWWPRSLGLSTELPTLLAVLTPRLGRIQRVSYNLDTWDTAPRRLDIGGERVRLGGYHAQNPHTVDVIGLNGSRLTLLVLRPATDEAIAHETLMTAARRDNVDGIEHLLAPAGRK